MARMDPLSSESQEEASRRSHAKGTKRERTRAALLDAAREVIREKGYDRTTMEDVAARAGMTTGAIYGNFRNRDELLVSLGEAYWAPVVPRLAPGATFADAMQALAAASLSAVDARRPYVVGRLTGVAYTLGNEELRARVRQITQDSYELGAEWLRSFDARELPMPAHLLIVVLHAMIEGLVLQRLLTPELCPDEVFHEAFGIFAAMPA